MVVGVRLGPGVGVAGGVRVAVAVLDGVALTAGVSVGVLVGPAITDRSTLPYSSVSIVSYVWMLNDESTAGGLARAKVTVFGPVV